MREILQMDRIMEKLTILSAAARYDVACTSSGVQRGQSASTSTVRYPIAAQKST